MLNHKYYIQIMRGGGVYYRCFEKISLWPWDCTKLLVQIPHNKRVLLNGKIILFLTSPETFIVESHVPTSFWPEAITTATYLTNRLPSEPLQYKTSLDTLRSFVSIPSSHSLPPRVFGCVVYVHLPPKAWTKLEPRALKCVFLGYEIN